MSVYLCELRKLKDHIIYYHWEIHEKTKCDECYRSFIDTDKLEKHKCMIHPAKNTEEQLNENYQPEDIMRCNVGKKEFSKSSNLTRHINYVHEKNKCFSYLCTFTTTKKRQVVQNNNN